jgi:hypothetical protein
MPVEEPVKFAGNFGWFATTTNKKTAAQPANAHTCFARETIRRVQRKLGAPHVTAAAPSGNFHDGCSNTPGRLRLIEAPAP